MDINASPQLGAGQLADEPSTSSALISGSLDYISLTSAEGWAFNPANPEERVEVSILADGRTVWTGLANEMRPDLSRSGIGDGRHAFYARFGSVSALHGRTQVAIQSVAVLSGTELPNSPAQLDVELGASVLFSQEDLESVSLVAVADVQDSDPEMAGVDGEPEPAPRFSGCLDAVTESTIRGWAYNERQPDVPVAVDILDGDTLIARANADVFRDDLKAAGFTDGRHSFIVPTPPSLLDERPHLITARVTNTVYCLPRSPMKVTLDSALPFQILTRLQTSTSEGLKALQRLEDLIGTGLLQSVRSGQKVNDTYQKWTSRFGALPSDTRERMARRILELQHQPMFSIVMPTYNTPKKFLQAAVQSVIGQIYPFWELCIADDHSSAPTIDALKQIQALDPRIKIVFRQTNGHISEATNSALSIATGSHICFMDHDDLLTPDALYQMALRIQSSDPALLYSDEDKIDRRNVAVEPHFKPDFNYRLLLSYNYICHLLVVKRELVDRVGAFDSRYNGSQDHDFLLRCCELTRPDQIQHVPLILYHWRAHEDSTASDLSTKNYAAVAGQAAIRDHLHRTGRLAGVTDGVFGTYKVEWATPEVLPKVSVIVPTRDSAKILSVALSGLVYQTDYPSIEVIVVDNGSVEPETFKLFAEMEKYAGVRVVRFDRDFNYSEICNFGASFATGSLLLMLNNDIEVIDGAWLLEMVRECMQSGVGAVGAKLLYPNDCVQHSGVILGIGGVAGHAHKFLRHDEPGYMTRNLVAQDMSACTAACLLIRAEVFSQIGGFDAVNLPVAFNDVDLCLRIVQAGYRIVFTPQAVLRHHESVSRGAEDNPAKHFRSQKEISYMLDTWGDLLIADPHYSPNLTLRAEDLSIDPERGFERT